MRHTDVDLRPWRLKGRQQSQRDCSFPRLSHQQFQTLLIHDLAPLVRRSLAQTELKLRQHPRAVSATVLTLLLGTGVTAFGVAPLTVVDPSPVATQLIQQEVQAVAVPSQLEALETFSLALHRNDLTRGSDTAESLLQRLGVNDPEAARFLREDVLARQILTGRVGKRVQVRSESAPGGGQLLEMIVRGPAAGGDDAALHFTRTTLRRTAEGFVSSSEQVALQHQPMLGSGRIESSLFAAADEAMLPDAVTIQLAEIFGADIDFRRELRKGDSFSVVYDQPTADGEPVTWTSGSGRVLAARFVNQGKAHEAIWFQDGDQRGSYFGPDGNSKLRMFLSSPLAFSRVTSGFAMRFHPIHKTWRAHLGVDYAAPTGTPVRSIGDGVVEFAGVQSGYGNVVIVRHNAERSTVYAHLSRIGVKRGERVGQGSTVGAVGSTGWATGPHLHFEFKIDGRQVDPVKMARASETVQLVAAARPRFQAAATVALTQLDSASRQGVALARME